MNADALPYTLLILLAELTVGALAFVTLFVARGKVTHGYAQMGAVIVVPGALCTLLVVFGIEARDEIDGFTLRPDAFEVFRVVFVAFTAVAVAHLIATFGERMRAAQLLGAAGSAIGVLAIGALAAAVSQPAWSYVGVLASMLASAVVLGGTLMAMSWGHWYLTNARLPKEPLEEMSLVVFGALVVQALLMVVALIAPVREVPLTQSAFGVALGENPAFWFRVGVGLVFPLVLAWLAWRAAAIHGMMSATGLLYIAVGAVFTGEVLARGLFFATGSAV